MTYEYALDQIEIDRKFFLMILTEIFVNDWKYSTNDL